MRNRLHCMQRLLCDASLAIAGDNNSTQLNSTQSEARQRPLCDSNRSGLSLSLSLSLSLPSQFRVAQLLRNPELERGTLKVVAQVACLLALSFPTFFAGRLSHSFSFLLGRGSCYELACCLPARLRQSVSLNRCSLSLSHRAPSKSLGINQCFLHVVLFISVNPGSYNCLKTKQTNKQNI